MDTLLRAAVATLEGAKKEGQVTYFKPDDRPGNTVWLDAINDVTWWRYELGEPALLHLNRRAAPVSQVGHNARTGFSNNVVAEADRGSSLQSEGPPNKKRLTGDKKHHETRPLCLDHNSGRCSNTVWVIKCLGSHISSDCPHQEVPHTYWSDKAQNGRGKEKESIDRHGPPCRHGKVGLSSTVLLAALPLSWSPRRRRGR